VNDNAILGQVALGYSPFIDKSRAITATRLTVFPLRPELSPDAGQLLRAVAGVWPETGGKVSLTELLASKKAVLVNFWFYGCGPCRAETPHLQKLYTQLKDKGFEIIAINLGDEPESIQKYIKDFNVTFPIALGGRPRGNERTVFSDYGVSAYPTNFLIDHDAKVVWHSRGYDEASIEELRKELEKLGVK